MSQKIQVVPMRGNSIVVFSPPPQDGSQAVSGVLAAGQGFGIEKGSFLATDTIVVTVWDADDYAAAQLAEQQG